MLFDLGKIYTQIGETKDRPFKFAISVTSTSFGDVLGSFILAERIAANFKHSLATFLIRNDRPYKQRFLHLYQRPYQVIDVKPNEPAPLHLFNPGMVGRKYPVDSFHWQDLIVPPQYSTGFYWWSFPYGRLGFKEKLIADGERRLMNLGLDPDNWFVSLHYREPNYRWKPMANHRDVDPDLYNQVIDWVIEEHGGQVVRLGHPEMRAVKPRKGLVDLSRYPDSELFQAYAVARSAFLFSSPTGAVAFADCFRIPTFLADASDFWVGYDNQIVMTHKLVHDDGQELRNGALMSSPYNTTLNYDSAFAKGYKIMKSSAEDLRAGLRFMVDKVNLDKPWRDIKPLEYSGRRSIEWPPVPTIEPRFFDPADGTLCKVRLQN